MSKSSGQTGRLSPTQALTRVWALRVDTFAQRREARAAPARVDMGSHSFIQYIFFPVPPIAILPPSRDRVVNKRDRPGPNRKTGSRYTT